MKLLCHANMNNKNVHFTRFLLIKSFRSSPPKSTKNILPAFTDGPSYLYKPNQTWCYLKIDAHVVTLNMCLFDYTPKIRGLCSCGTTLKRTVVGLTVVELMAEWTKGVCNSTSLQIEQEYSDQVWGGGAGVAFQCCSKAQPRLLKAITVLQLFGHCVITKKEGSYS